MYHIPYYPQAVCLIENEWSFQGIFKKRDNSCTNWKDILFLGL